MKIEQLINTLKKHISLAEKSRWYAEQGDEERSNKFDDEMQEIESYLMEELGIELDSYGIIQTLNTEDPADRDDRLYHEEQDHIAMGIIKENK